MVIAISSAYELFLWRWLPWPGRPPVLRGTWKLAIKPTTNPGGAETPENAEIVCFARIRQTASTGHAKILYDDGHSQTTTVLLTRDPDDRTHRVLIFYDFEPDKVTSETPRRKGAASLDVIITPRVLVLHPLRRKIALDGRFWSDALTSGKIESQGRSSKLYDSFQDANAGDYTR